MRKYFLPQNWRNGTKIGFFEFIEKFSQYFFWIWPIAKINISCCIIAQIWFLIYGPKCSLSLSVYRTQKSAITGWWFFACWYRFMKIKSWLKNIGVDVVKNGPLRILRILWLHIFWWNEWIKLTLSSPPKLT